MTADIQATQYHETALAEMPAEDLLLEIEYCADQMRHNAAMLNLKCSVFPDPFPYVSHNQLCEDGQIKYFEWRALTQEAHRRHLVFVETIFDFENVPANEPEAVN